VAGKGIDDVVGHYARIIRGPEAPPVVMGHSFGGLIAQRLIGQDLAAVAVAIDAAPIKGVLKLPVHALKVASIALRKPANATWRYRSPRSSSGTASGTCFPSRSQLSCKPLDSTLAWQALVRSRPGELHPRGRQRR
jgi:non-heme chloroperoxidase